jgi:hypothetical protein
LVVLFGLAGQSVLGGIFGVVEVENPVNLRQFEFVGGFGVCFMTFFCECMFFGGGTGCIIGFIDGEAGV